MSNYKGDFRLGEGGGDTPRVIHVKSPLMAGNFQTVLAQPETVSYDSGVSRLRRTRLSERASQATSAILAECAGLITPDSARRTS